MFDLIKSGVKIKLVEGCIKGVANAIKDPHARKVVGVVGLSFGVGLIASSYV